MNDRVSAIVSAACGLGWPENPAVLTYGRPSGLGWPVPAPAAVRPVERTTIVTQTPLNPGDSPLVREALSSVVSRETSPQKTAAASGGSAGTRDGDWPRPPKTRIFTVANQKGGVGKTTTSVNLAAALAMHGQRVLVVDLDPQGNASTALGDRAPWRRPEHVRGPGRGRVAGGGRAGVPDLPGLYCAPATIDLAGAEIELVSMVARETRLQRALEPTYRAAMTFDYVFIDCPPSLGLLTVNALVAANEVLIPIQCEYYALEGSRPAAHNVELIQAHLNPSLDVSHHPADDV